MALDATALKDLMKTKIDAIDFSSGSITNDQALLALAEAVVEHIQAAAEVPIPGGSSAGTYPVQ